MSTHPSKQDAASPAGVGGLNLRDRHLAGIRLVDDASEASEFAEPAFESLPEGQTPPEVGPDELTAGLLRAAILRHGCLLVRGLVGRSEAQELAVEIDLAFEARSSGNGGSGSGYYEEFEPEPRYHGSLGERGWIEIGGGVLAVDSPRVTGRVFGALERRQFPELVSAYLGEPAAISAQKTTLRKAEPAVVGHWHQDGKFLGDVRALNLWLSFSRCGDEAPGLDIVPRRLDELVEAGGEDNVLDYTVTQEVAEEAAGELGVKRPIFEPGDALLFDELFLHQTGSSPGMRKPRYALESWFFGASAFPDSYAPLSV